MKRVARRKSVVWGTIVSNYQALSDRGIACDYVTGGGTGTFPYEAASGVFTEVQPVSLSVDIHPSWPVKSRVRHVSKCGVFLDNLPQGSYVLMDVDYGKNYGEDGTFVHDFQHSLQVLTTVQSVTVSSDVASASLSLVVALGFRCSLNALGSTSVIS